MKRIQVLSALGIMALAWGTTAFVGPSPDNADTPQAAGSGGEYTLVVDGFDWGPGVSKVILHMEESVTEADPGDFAVMARRSSDAFEIRESEATGERTIVHAYVSDETGKWMESGSHITLVLFVSPRLPLASPFQYARIGNEGRNRWVDYRVTVTRLTDRKVWDRPAGRLSPPADRFDLSGRFVYKEDPAISYAWYDPGNPSGKSPLIIWLHGGGEGGDDPSIPLLANRAANYASEEIQAIFGGAYVLVPQCPGAWMHNTEGMMTHGAEDDVYHVGLMTLIRDFVHARPDIDRDRIYLGGCSNGGYMSLKLILEHPDYFAAGYISALAYQSQYLSDAQIRSIRHVPIWFVHAADDGTTVPEETVIPVYKRLKASGAEHVFCSYYDHVVDLSGFYGGEDYHHPGHWSWVYSHANHCRLDLDGSPVMADGRPVHLMEWLAAQRK